MSAAITTERRDPETGRRICGAKRRNGEVCRMAPMANGRCRLHGGNAARGLAAGRFVDGSRSKYLPARMIPRFQEAMADGDLINMTEDLALLEARMADVLKRVDSGETSAIWTDLRLAWGMLRQAQMAEDQTAAAQALGQLGRLIYRGASDAAAWREVGELIERRRKVIETEQKRRIAAGRLISIEQAMLVVVAIQEAVKAHVNDRPTLARISESVSRILPPDRAGMEGTEA